MTHELSFVLLGRPQTYTLASNPFDMFGFSAAGVRDYTYSNAGRYFSIDNGNTVLHLGNGWAGGNYANSCDDFNPSGYTGPFIDPNYQSRTGKLTQIDAKYFGLFLPMSTAGLAKAGY